MSFNHLRSVLQMKKIFFTSASTLILGYYCYFIITKWDSLCGLINLKLNYSLIMVLLIFLTWITNAFQSKVLLDAQGVRISFIDNFYLVCASACGNYLPFRLGTVFRMYYLKKHFNYKYHNFGYFLLFRFSILFVITGGIGTICIIYLYVSYLKFNFYLLLIMVSFIIIPVFGYNLQRSNILNLLFLKYPMINYEKFKNDFGFLINDRKLIFKMSAFIFLQVLLFTFRFYISMVLIQINLPLIVLFFMAPIAIITSLLTITPGGIGMRETLLGMVSGLTGYGFETGVFMATIDRAILILMTLVFGISSFIILNGKYHTNNNDNDCYDELKIL